MNDPFSINRRRPLEWELYQNLYAQLRTNSLLDSEWHTRSQRQRRLLELDEYEATFGFVFVGERNWLLQIENNGVCSYDEWVMSQYCAGLFPKRSKASDEDAPESGDWWDFYVQTNLELFPIPDDNPGLLIEVDYIDPLVPGDVTFPNTDSLVASFQILHELNYHLIDASQRNAGYRSLHGLSVDCSQTHWHMTLMSDYGSDYQVHFAF